MISTLISTNTADSDSALAITSGIDGTYDEYMFVMTDIHPETDNNIWQFQASTDGGSSYGVTVTSTAFQSQHSEDDSAASLGYMAGDDLAQAAGYQYLAAAGLGNGADESLAGVFHIFNPASTTFVKHWYCRTNMYYVSNYTKDSYFAGYFNTTSAINAFNFGMGAGGDFSGVIQLYGIA